MVQEKTTNLFDVVLVIGRQYPPRLHRGHRFVDLAILARAHIAGVRVIPSGRDAETMEEVERQQGIAARASLIVPGVAIDELLHGQIGGVDGFALDALGQVDGVPPPVRGARPRGLAGGVRVPVGDVRHVPRDGGYIINIEGGGGVGRKKDEIAHIPG